MDLCGILVNAIRWPNKLRGTLNGVLKAPRRKRGATYGQLCNVHVQLTNYYQHDTLVNSIKIIVSFLHQISISFSLNLCVCLRSFWIPRFTTRKYFCVCLRIVVDRNFGWTWTCQRRPYENVVDSVASHRMVVQEPPKIKWEKRRRE